MKRDTRADQGTRHIDIPADPIATTRDALFADRLEMIADEYRGESRPVFADLLIGGAVARRGDEPVTSSPVVRTAHAWAISEKRVRDESDWAQILVEAAAAAMNFRSITTADFLRGVAAALGGMTKAPTGASSTYRMGMKAVQECERGRPQYTQLAMAAMPETMPDGPPPAEDPLEHALTQPHAAATAEDGLTRPHRAAEPVPPPLLTRPPAAPTAPIVRAKIPVVREDDAPVRRGTAGEDDLTRAHLIPRTERLKGPAK